MSASIFNLRPELKTDFVSKVSSDVCALTKRRLLASQQAVDRGKTARSTRWAGWAGDGEDVRKKRPPKGRSNHT